MRKGQAGHPDLLNFNRTMDRSSTLLPDRSRSPSLELAHTHCPRGCITPPEPLPAFTNRDVLTQFLIDNRMKVSDVNSNDIELFDPPSFPNQNTEVTSQEVRQNWWGCQDCKRILDSPHISDDHQLESNEPDSLTDIGQYVHDIVDDDDEDTVEAKDAFNQALITSTELEIMHREAIDHGSGTTIDKLWNLRSTSDQLKVTHLEVEDPTDRLQYSFAHNTMIEDLDLTLPIIQPRETSSDTTMDILTNNFASIEISMPATHHRTWLSNQWQPPKQ